MRYFQINNEDEEDEDDKDQILLMTVLLKQFYNLFDVQSKNKIIKTQKRDMYIYGIGDICLLSHGDCISIKILG